MPKHTSCHKWIFIVQPGVVQDHFPQNVLKFGFGDSKNVYEKRKPNTIFPQDPPKIGYVDGENRKKYMKREENKYLFQKLAVY